MENTIRFETVIITPKQAESWLELNKDNRKTSKKKIMEYANEIKNGRWRYTHQGIAFDKDGYLLDGQHRLQAIIDSGIALKTVVACGVDRGEFTILDRGFPRNLMVITGIEKYYTEIYTLLITFVLKHSTRPSPDDVYILHKILGTTVSQLKDSCNAKTKFYTSAPFRTAAIVAIKSGENQNYVFDCYKKLAYGSQTMPPVAFSIYKNHTTTGNSAWASRIEIYCKARFAFTEQNKNNRMIRINDLLQEQYEKEVSVLISDVMMQNPENRENELLKVIERKNLEIQREREIYLRVVSQNIQAEQVKLTMGAID